MTRANIDRVRSYLKKRGCPAHVVKGGLQGLVEQWEETTISVAGGYELGLEDYLNDMDGRQLIADVMKLAPAAVRKNLGSRVAKADTRIKAVLKPARVCLWGESEAKKRRWTARSNWWYFRIPENAGLDLADDLTAGTGRPQR
jgi:hypothetical protein